MTKKIKIKEIPTKNEVEFNLSYEGVVVGFAHIYRLGDKPYGWRVQATFRRKDIEPEKFRIFRDGDIRDFKNTADALGNIIRVVKDAFGYDFIVVQDD